MARPNKTKIAIVYEGVIEIYPSGKLIPVEVRRPSPGKLPKQVVELLRREAPLQYVYIADPLEVNVRELSAKQVPLGAGEEAWRAEVAKEWGVSPKEIRARHYPTADGALVVAVYAEDLQALWRIKGVKGVYPLPLLVAHTAHDIKEAGFAIFWRKHYLLLAAAREGEIVSILPTAGTEITSELLRGEIEMQQHTLLNSPVQRLRFVDSSPVDIGKPGITVEEVQALSSPPPELGWERAAPVWQRYTPAAYGLAAGVLLAMGVQFYLGAQASTLRGELTALEAQKSELRRALAREPAIKKRMADIQAILTATSTDSPIYQSLLKIAQNTPGGVLVSEVEINDKEINLILYAKSTQRLAETLRAYTVALGVTPIASKLAAEDGWRRLEVSLPAPEAR